MNRELYRELWQIRFNKMLDLEQKAVTEYKALLEESRAISKGHSIEPHLESLILDEGRHVSLVKKLLAILARQA